MAFKARDSGTDYSLYVYAVMLIKTLILNGYKGMLEI